MKALISAKVQFSKFLGLNKLFIGKSQTQVQSLFATTQVRGVNRCEHVDMGIKGSVEFV